MNAWLRIDPSIVDTVRQLDNQPKVIPNYWEDLKKWAFSKKWFVAVMLVAVGVPWCVGIVHGIKLIWNWFAVGP